MAAIVRSTAWTPCQQTSGVRRCRRRLPARVQAGLLDLFRGGASPAQTLPEDAAGMALMHWLDEQGLPPQKVRRTARSRQG